MITSLQTLNVMLDQFLSVCYWLQTERQTENYKGEVTDGLTIRHLTLHGRIW